MYQVDPSFIVPFIPYATAGVVSIVLGCLNPVKHIEVEHKDRETGKLVCYESYFNWLRKVNLFSYKKYDKLHNVTICHYGKLTIHDDSESTITSIKVTPYKSLSVLAFGLLSLGMSWFVKV